MQRHAGDTRAQRGKAAVWILGGGVPRYCTRRGEPLLSPIPGVDNGAPSPCSAGEGHTWGKTSAECVESSAAYLRTDVTVAAPFIAEALLSDPTLRRAPGRLFARLAEAEQALDALWLRP